MRRSRLFFVLVALGLTLAVCGCGRRLSATVQAAASSLPIPTDLSWVAVPGSGVSLPASVSADGASTERTELDLVAAPLAGALTVYNWTWISHPAQADVLVRIWWETSEPSTVLDGSDVYYRDPYYRRSSMFGFGMGTGWNRHGYRSRHNSFFGSRYGYGYTEPTIHTVYTHTLTIEALRATALPAALRAALLASVSPLSPASVKPASHNTSAATSPETLSQPPYAPALSTQGNPAAQEPYAPPILDANTSIPPEAVLWRVVVTSTGSRSNTQDLLPQLTAAALSLVGKSAEVTAEVDSDLNVTMP
ncbi:MAG: hypothetical protein RRY20_00870 [Bilophila sp.]